MSSKYNPVFLISGYLLDPLNRYVDVSFDPDVYHSSGGALQAGDLQLIFDQNGGNATNCTISSITNTSGGALAGGENTVRVNLSITGSPSGDETILIKANAYGSYKDSTGKLVSADDSTSEISLNLGYHSTYAAALGYALDNSILLPSDAQKILDNDLITTLDTEGVLAEVDILYLVAGDAGREFAKINIKSPGNFTLAENNTPTYNTNLGFKGNSTNMSLNTGWKPKTNGVKYADSDASIIYYCSEDIAQNSILDFGVRGDSSVPNTTAGRTVFNPRNAANSLSYRINLQTTGVLSIASSTNSKALWHVLRSGSNVKVYKDGSSFGTATDGSGTRSDYDLHLLCENVGGTLGSFSSRTIGLFMAGSNLEAKAAEISTAVNTWATAKESPPSDSGRVYGVIGQSQNDGRGEYDELPAYLQDEIENCFYWTGSAWVPLHAGVAGGGIHTIGPIFSLAYAESVKHPGENLYFIKHAVGGTDMETDWAPGGPQYNAFIAKYNAAVASLTVTSFEAVYHAQGEADCKDLDKANGYEVNEQAFATALFADTGFTRLIVMQIHDSLPSVSYPYDATVRTAKSNNFDDDVYGVDGALITTNDLPLKSDSIHFNTAGVVTLGERYSAATV